MKILLVTAPRNREGFDASSLFLMEPLGLEYLGAAVKDHHDVRVVDLKADNEPDLKEVLESYQPDVIGCSSYTPDMNYAKEALAEAKKMMPGILTVIGGQHATVMPQDFFTDSIDVVVVGEGVHPFRKICERHDKQKSFEGIDNIYYKKNGKMVFTKKTEHPPLDTLPMPDRSLTAHLRDEYKLYLLLNRPMKYASVRASLGCPYDCKFCAVTSMLNRKLYRHSVDRVVEELAALEDPAVFWVDDEFLIQPDKAIELAKAIESAGIKKYHFICNRSDTVINHPEVIEAWARIGLTLALLGTESHRDDDLSAMRKKTTVSKNEEAVRICHANGVKVRGGFIVHQYYDKNDFKELTYYPREIGIDYPAFSVMTPLPGTELYEEKKNEIILHNYNFYDMVHTVLPTKLPLKQFFREFSNLFKNVVSLKEKLRMVRQMPPEDRKKLITKSRKMLSRIKKFYRDYDKSLW